MQYMNASLNDSMTITDKAAGPIVNGGMKIVAFDSNGNLAIPDTEGVPVVGIILSDEPENIPAGGDVTVQVKDGGLSRAGAAFPKGALLMTNAAGKAVAATTGKYAFAIALEAAEAEDDIVAIRICHPGYVA